MGSLRTRIVAAFLTVVLLGVLFIWTGALWATRTTFKDYLTKQHEARALALADFLGEFYRISGSWMGVESLFGERTGHHGGGMGKMQQQGPGQGHLQGQTERVVIFKADGSVLLDTGPGYNPAPSLLEKSAVDIMVGGAKTGSVAVAPASSIVGALGVLEDGFLNKVESALWVAGGVSLALGLMVALRFSYELAKPIELLEEAATKVAQGSLGEQAHMGDGKLPSEVKKLVEAFNAMSRKLGQIDANRRKLAQDLAHEIRTPLTILKGNLEATAVGAGVFDKTNLQSMLEEVDRLAGLADNLSELDRISKSRPFSPRLISAETLVQRALAAVQGAAMKESINIRTHTQKGLGEVYADPDAVQQVFSNLLSNAMRYTPSDGTIEIGAKKGSRAQVLFWVKDSGPGIAQADLGRIFERFYRGDPSRTRSTGGSGLGLAIAKSLVEGSGGSIWAENHPLGGAILHFSLPTT